MNIKSLKSHQIPDSSEVKYYCLLYYNVGLIWFGFVSLGFAFVSFLSVCFGFSVFGL